MFCGLGQIPWLEYPIVYDVRAKPRNIASLTGTKGAPFSITSLSYGTDDDSAILILHLFVRIIFRHYVNARHDFRSPSLLVCLRTRRSLRQICKWSTLLAVSCPGLPSQSSPPSTESSGSTTTSGCCRPSSMKCSRVLSLSSMRRNVSSYTKRHWKKVKLTDSSDVRASQSSRKERWFRA